MISLMERIKENEVMRDTIIAKNKANTLNVETLAAVHTHTHTHTHRYNIIN